MTIKDASVEHKLITLWLSNNDNTKIGLSARRESVHDVKRVNYFGARQIKAQNPTSKITRGNSVILIRPDFTMRRLFGKLDY